MPMLGDVLAAARRSSGGMEAWLAAHDPATAKQVREAAGRDGLSATGFVRGAIAEFARSASPEDWASLTSRLRDSDDPGLTCLVAMLRWRIDASPASALTAAEGPTDERQA